MSLRRCCNPSVRHVRNLSKQKVSRTHELSVFAVTLDQNTSSHQQLMVSHKELSLAAVADRDANEERWNKFELRLHAVESHVNSFISGLKSTLEEMDDGPAGLQGKIGNNDLATWEIKTRLMTLRRLVKQKLRVSAKMS